MNKYFILFFVLVLLFCLEGCGKRGFLKPPSDDNTLSYKYPPEE